MYTKVIKEDYDVDSDSGPADERQAINVQYEMRIRSEMDEGAYFPPVIPASVNTGLEQRRTD